jgi:hypothetical protein
MQEISVLVGNGLSIAANNQMSMKALSESFKSRLLEHRKIGPGIVQMMEDLAENPFGENSEMYRADFEELIGVLEEQEIHLRNFCKVYPRGGDSNESLGDAIYQAHGLAELWHSAAVVHLLELIHERSNSTETDTLVVSKFVELITNQFPGICTFGNLNYDQILHQTLVEHHKHELADLAHGGIGGHGTWNLDGSKVNYFRLRTDWKYLPLNRRIRIFHLHGAINFWEIIETKTQIKVDNWAINQFDLIRRVGLDKKVGRPLVVLSKSRKKNEKVDAEPFRLAYQSFGNSLGRSNHWLIAGYSFRDDSINTLLAEKLLLAKQSGRRGKVLVVLKNDPYWDARRIRKLITSKVNGLSKKDFELDVSQSGIEKMRESPEWRDFVEDVVPF